MIELLYKDVERKKPEWIKLPLFDIRDVRQFRRANAWIGYFDKMKIPYIMKPIRAQKGIMFRIKYWGIRGSL